MSQAPSPLVVSSTGTTSSRESLKHRKHQNDIYDSLRAAQTEDVGNVELVEQKPLLTSTSEEETEANHIKASTTTTTTNSNSTVTPQSLADAAYEKYRDKMEQYKSSDKRLRVISLVVVLVLLVLLFQDEASLSLTPAPAQEDTVVPTKLPRGIAMSPLLQYINQSASQLFPDQFPNLLFLLQQEPLLGTNSSFNTTTTTTTYKYTLLQSMNTYWKQGHSFRKHELGFNQELLQNALYALNQDFNTNSMKNIHQTQQSHVWSFLHQRIHDAGGSLPFFTNWRVYYSANNNNYTTTPAVCPNEEDMIPIFQRAIPPEVVACHSMNGKDDKVEMTLYSDYHYWTVPTAPIWKQLKPKFGEVVPRGNQQLQAVVVAEPVAESSNPLSLADLQSVNETRVTLQRMANSKDDQLAGKLVFLPPNVHDSDVKNYDKYTAVFDTDTTSSLYPSLLCQTSVLLKRHPPPPNEIDALRPTLEPWVHFVPILPTSIQRHEEEWPDLKQQVEYVLDPQNAEQMDAIVANANEWCEKYKNKKYMTQQFLQSLTTFVERLDAHDTSWTKQWKEHREEYLQGHWMRQLGGDSWTLPKQIVGEIKHSGIRADDPRVTELWNQ